MALTRAGAIRNSAADELRRLRPHGARDMAAQPVDPAGARRARDRDRGSLVRAPAERAGRGKRRAAEAQRIERELGFVHKDNDRLAGRIKSTERELRVTGLAGRAKKSVFTIVAGRSIGTAFAAWRTGEGTFFVTANHVVEGWNGGVVL